MKINPLNNLPFGVSMPNTSRKQTTFTANPNPKKVYKHFNTGQKICYVANQYKVGDIIAVGKDYGSVLSLLKDKVENFNFLLKKLWFVKDGGLKSPFAITKDIENNDIITNIGTTPIIVAGAATLGDFAKNAPNKESFQKEILSELENTNENDILPYQFILDPGISCPITDGNIIVDGNRFIELDINSRTLKGPTRENVSDCYDLTVPTQLKIEEENDKIFTSILEKEKIITKKKAKNKDKTQTNSTNISFADIGGLDKQIEMIKRNLLFPMKYPKAFENIKVNHGILLYGPPGTGKTMLAQALANEADGNFIKINGLEMESKWVGESEKNWRNLFDEAKKTQPCIVFIDEIDAVAKKRGGQDIHGDKVVNQLLSLMSDIEKEKSQVYVVAATNNEKSIDPAVMRSGRFGMKIEIPTPDKDGLKKIFEIKSANLKIDKDVDSNIIAEQLLKNKMTGADVDRILELAFQNSYIRSGVFDKMAAGNYPEEEMMVDLARTFITNEDFNKAFEDHKKTSVDQSRKMIGFNH